MKLQKFFITLFLTFIFGCSINENMAKNKELIDNLKLYQIYVDEKGRLLNPASKKIVENEYIYVNEILKNFKKMKEDNPQLVLTIFIHGGLNTFKVATERAKRVKDKILNDNKYPLFISWNAGPLTNYKDHLFFLRKGEESLILGPLSSPFILLEDSLRSISRIPTSTYNVLFGQNSVRINNYTKEEDAYNKSLGIIKSQPFVLHNSPNDTGHNLGDWVTVWNPIKLITAPFIDGLGTGAWNSMLRRTDLVLKKDKAFHGQSGSVSDTATTKFFDGLNKQFPNQKIDLIGHSMGTIISNNILSKYPEMNFNNIVYLAAACKVKDLKYVVAPYLNKNSDSTFYNVSLNPYRDINENNAYDFVPRGSLLIWIDQTFGDINSFQDRTAGFWFNIVRSASNTFKGDKVQSQVHLTQFGIKDDSPQNHGDFSNFDFWKQSFWNGEL